MRMSGYLNNESDGTQIRFYIKKMPRVYLNEKEAAAVIVIVEAFIISNPTAKTSEAAAKYHSGFWIV